MDDAEDDYLPLVPSIFSSGLMPVSSSAGEGPEAVAVGAVWVAEADFTCFGELIFLDVEDHLNAEAGVPSLIPRLPQPNSRFLRISEPNLPSLFKPFLKPMVFLRQLWYPVPPSSAGAAQRVPLTLLLSDDRFALRVCPSLSSLRWARSALRFHLALLMWPSIFFDVVFECCSDSSGLDLDAT